MTAIATNASSLRPIGSVDVSVDEATVEEQTHALSRSQAAAVVLSVGLGVVVAGYGLAGSYVAVSELAARHGVPLAGWVPAGIAGGLVAVVVLDLVLPNRHRHRTAGAARDHTAAGSLGRRCRRGM